MLGKRTRFCGVVGWWEGSRVLDMGEDNGRDSRVREGVRIAGECWG